MTAWKKFDPEKEFAVVTEELWQYVYNRDGGMCQAAKKGCNKSGSQAHHIRYRSGCGKHKASNLIMLCVNCHHREHNIEPLGEACYLSRAEKNEKKFKSRLV